jgi:hypothetical protein
MVIHFCILFKSALFTASDLLGAFHNLAGGFDIDQKRASSFAVDTAEFLVQQKISIGFRYE